MRNEASEEQKWLTISTVFSYLFKNIKKKTFNISTVKSKSQLAIGDIYESTYYYHT